MTRTSLSVCALALLPLFGVGPRRAVAARAADEPAAPPAGSADAASSPSSNSNSNLVMIPTVAVAAGPVWSLVPAASTSLAVDVTVGAVLGWPGSRADGEGETSARPLQREERYLKGTLWLQPELGYTYERGDQTNPQLSGHLGSLGLGLGYGNLLFSSIAYTPRLVVGELGDALAVGLRHGISGHFLGRLFSIELSHQMVWTAGEVHHELRLLLGLNASALLVNRQ